MSTTSSSWWNGDGTSAANNGGGTAGDWRRQGDLELYTTRRLPFLIAAACAKQRRSPSCEQLRRRPAASAPYSPKKKIGDSAVPPCPTLGPPLDARVLVRGA
ncbi:hypothetical protein GUJ93_ZPchr0006g45461 [Zizania palustris]|uniref:Uncharacterized protein n=1 Tax=Zizania palustris TaxID=103762 RepID=A0A8J5VJ54_ZIZPA|nr:hypothetical protein GUJ93_ZPchr0006g45461 [Zizania palustris]